MIHPALIHPASEPTSQTRRATGLAAFLPFLSLCAALTSIACIEHAKLNPKALHHNDAGAALLAKGALTEAAPYFDLALEYHPLFDKPHYNKGLLAFRGGDLTAALGHFLRAAELNPDFADAHNGAGRVFLERNQLGDAERYFRRALEVNPGLINARFNLGRTLVAQGRTELARAEYHKLLVSEPKSAEGQAGLAATLHAEGKLPLAEGRYRRALEADPACEEAWLGLGAVLLATGRVTAAADAYQRAVRAHPTSPRARHALAFALLRSERPAEGKAELATLLALAPAFAPGHFLNGVVAELEGRLLDAEAAFRRALRHQPHYPETDYRLCTLLAAQRRAESRPHCLSFAKSAEPRYQEEARKARALAQSPFFY